MKLEDWRETFPALLPAKLVAIMRFMNAIKKVSRCDNDWVKNA